MQKIFVATDRNGTAYTYTNKPVWQDSTGTFAGHWRFVDCDTSFAPPPGECREYRLVPVGEADANDARIAGLEKQLAERSPGVMPEVVAQLLGYLRDGDVPPLDVENAVRAYFAPPAGHEWRPVDEANPITAADVGRKVSFRHGGIGAVSEYRHHVPWAIRVDDIGFHASGPRIRGKISQHDITHILRPIAPKFVFDGTEGRYETDTGWQGDLLVRNGTMVILLATGGWGEVNSDGTFDGGRITGRSE